MKTAIKLSVRKRKRIEKTKRVNWSEHIERYLNCPHCSRFISDSSFPINIFEGQSIVCPYCGKEIQLGECI